MTRAWKWIGIVGGGLAAVLAILLVVVYTVSGSRVHRRFEVAGHDVTVPEDSASVANGERLTHVLGCRSCHGDDLGGFLFIDAPVFARIAAPNITTGPGGIGDFTPRDYERAIRHGVRPDGAGLVVMPAGDYHSLSDRDVGDLIAYLRAAPPVERELTDRHFGPVSRAIVVFGGLVPAAAATIAHDEPHLAEITRGPTAEYGEYLATAVCMGCHRPNLAGGSTGVPDEPPAANLTPDSTGLGSWTFDGFVAAMRTGRRPDGSAIDSAMPWPVLARYDDDELAAIWAYLRSIAPVSTSDR